MNKAYYHNTLVMKRHLNTSAYQKVHSNSDKSAFNDLEFLIKKNTNLV